ncbi:MULTISPECIES: hypothetical protein [Proteus]|uniref:hypothetical protein n=1 Tax=Proteus TaxID=583 RepID=UPI0018C7EECC|nr:hypothetical protein [Proteus terrae]MBG2803193.1 hypothetical protein [Proteus mirabilis]QUT00953.1 hypothetical protein KF949_14460 [Proteus terrae subsp. cibarius]
MSSESLRKALKENPEWVRRYLKLDKPSKIRTRHVILFFSIVTLLMGIVYG